MTEAEKISVCGEPKRKDKVGRIITLLRGKGDRDFDIFLKLLRESGNEVWAGQLEEAVERFKRDTQGGGWSREWVECLIQYVRCVYTRCTASIVCSVYHPSHGGHLAVIYTLLGCTSCQCMHKVLVYHVQNHCVCCLFTVHVCVCFCIHVT